MNRFQRSWELFKSSMAVMGREKKLLLFPILTTMCTLFIVMLFVAPVALQPTGYAYTSSQHWETVGERIFKQAPQATTTVTQDAESLQITGRQASGGDFRPLALGYFALIYFASMFVATFFNVAFYSQILAALSGQPVSILRGLLFACTRWQTILAWTLFAGTAAPARLAVRRLGLWRLHRHSLGFRLAPRVCAGSGDPGSCTGSTHSGHCADGGVFRDPRPKCRRHRTLVCPGAPPQSPALLALSPEV